MNEFPRPCEVIIKYDRTLSKITGCLREKCIVSDELPFIFFLKNLFETYPEIELKYPPGELAFMVNGGAPNEFDLLSNGDEILIAGK